MTLSFAHAPIGVFDSGIGGLSVLKALQAEMPQAHLIYVGDSAHAPYGERDEEQVIERSQRISSWLVGQNVSALVIACNTATAAAIQQLRASHPNLPIIGVEPALKPAAESSQRKTVGVLATRSTLGSAKFAALLDAQPTDVRFILQPCDGLADAIERSLRSGSTTETIALCARYISAMGFFDAKNALADTLVLGCTHYVFAEGHLRKLLGPGVQIISTSHAVARQTRQQLQHAVQSTSPGAGSVRLLATGSTTALQAAARYWLGLTAGNVSPIAI